MRKRTAFPIALALAVTTLVAGGVALADDDDDGCEEIEAQINSTADLVNFTTAGTISGDLEGTTAFVGDLASITPVGGDPTVLAYTGALTVTTDDGSFTTAGTGVFEVGPDAPGSQFDEIVSGTGTYAGATGTLFATFFADATGVSFTSTFTGEICGIADDDDEDDDEEDDDDEDDDEDDDDEDDD